MNQTIKKLLLPFISLFLCAPLSHATTTIPPLTGRVVDTANMLSAETKLKLKLALEKHENQTTNQIAILTISKLDNQSIEDYAVHVFENWKLGTKSEDNGLLLVIAKEDRAMRIEIGYGLEGTLTDALSSQIIQDVMVPQFKRGNFDEGITLAIENIVKILKGEAIETQSKHDKQVIHGKAIIGLFGLIIFLFTLAVPGLPTFIIFLMTLPFIKVMGDLIFEGSSFLSFIIYIVLWVLLKLIFIKLKWQLKPSKNSRSGGSASSSGSSFSGGSSSSGFSGGGGSSGGGGASGKW